MTSLESAKHARQHKYKMCLQPAIDCATHKKAVLVARGGVGGEYVAVAGGRVQPTSNQTRPLLQHKSNTREAKISLELLGVIHILTCKFGMERQDVKRLRWGQRGMQHVDQLRNLLQTWHKYEHCAAAAATFGRAVLDNGGE